MNVHVTNPHGYCMGVISAIDLAKATQKQFPDRPVVVLGMLVHNREVVDLLAKQGIETLQDSEKSLEELLLGVDPKAIVIFTAHGHDRKLETLARQRGIEFRDATCVKVSKNMDIIQASLSEGHDVIYIGKVNHPETTAALSLGKRVFLLDKDFPFDYAKVKDASPLVVNQTTLSFLELAHLHAQITANIPDARVLDEICSATRLRQQAVLDIPEDVEAIFIVGSPESANTEKLAEVARLSHPRAKVIKIKTAADIDSRLSASFSKVAVASGASTPLETTETVIKFLKSL